MPNQKRVGDNCTRCHGTTNKRQRNADVAGLGHVISLISKHLAENNAHGDYMLAGSYTAWVRAKMMNVNIDLVYNDIDVFIRRPMMPKNDDQFILCEDKIDIEALPVQVNIVEVRKDWTLERLITNFDINAIRIGVLIRHSGLGSPVFPESTDWYICKSFDAFLKQPRLELPDVPSMRYPASSMVRMLKKSAEMNLPYSWPTKNEIEEYVDGKCIGEPTHKKLKKLPRAKQEEFEKVFELEMLEPRGSRSVPLWKLHFTGYLPSASSIVLPRKPKITRPSLAKIKQARQILSNPVGADIWEWY